MAKKGEMSFIQHLEALRWHLIRAFVVIFGITIFAFVYKEFLFDDVLFAPGNPNFITNRIMGDLASLLDMPLLAINNVPLKLQSIEMSGQFTTHLWIAFLAGIVIGFPYLFFELWRFIKPAFSEKELRHTRGAIFVVSFLFSIGILFGYYIVTPMSISFLVGYQVSPDVPNIVTLNSYVNTVTSITLSSAVLFELPVVIYFLAKIGLVSASFLSKYRRHALVVILIVAAIITPPDVVSQILVSVPLIFLYEISILVAKRIERNRAKRDNLIV